MMELSTFTIMRNRAVIAEELRRLLPRMEGLSSVKILPLGHAAIDNRLPRGGLACGALHEIIPDAGSTPAAFGFMAALLARVASPLPLPFPEGGRPPAPRARTIFIVLPAHGLRDHGCLHGHGLRVLGLDPSRVVLVETARRKDTLWALEEALRSRTPAAVAGAVDKLDLKSSQRLHLAAADGGLPLFLMRPSLTLESSAAATRWRIGTAEAARDRFGLFARARWRLALERCRNGRPGEWVVEYDHVAHRFSLVAALAGPALPRRAVEAGKSGESLARAHQA